MEMLLLVTTIIIMERQTLKQTSTTHTPVPQNFTLLSRRGLPPERLQGVDFPTKSTRRISSQVTPTRLDMALYPGLLVRQLPLLISPTALALCLEGQPRRRIPCHNTRPRRIPCLRRIYPRRIIKTLTSTNMPTTLWTTKAGTSSHEERNQTLDLYIETFRTT